MGLEGLELKNKKKVGIEVHCLSNFFIFLFFVLFLLGGGGGTLGQGVPILGSLHNFAQNNDDFHVI